MSLHDHEHEHSAPTAATLPPADYWSTIDELERTDAYLARLGEEFLPGAKPERYFEAEARGEQVESGLSRRTFMKLSGFAAVVAALQGCEKPVQKILPYAVAPEEIVIGQPNFYASTCTECAAACGILVKAREGRPIKVEGNPDHPVNRGALCARGQTTVMGLYDPDRQKFPVRVNRKGNRELDKNLRMAALDAEVGGRIGAAKGKVVLLTRTVHGPSNERLVREFLALGPNFQHVMYDALESGDERKAYGAAFGKEATPRYQWEKAKVIVAIGGDPLVEAASPLEARVGYGKGRKPTEAGMSRVYAFEPAPTLIGMGADYRYQVRPDRLAVVALALANEIVSSGKGPLAGDSTAKAFLSKYTLAQAAKDSGVAESELRRVARSLSDNPGASIVYTNGAAGQTDAPMALQFAGILLNQALGNYGATIDIADAPSKQRQGSQASLLELVAQMKRGEVDVLLFHGVNPAYMLPKAAGWADAVKKVGLVVSLSTTMDETSAMADVMIPAVHGLESWGDAEPIPGVYSLQQPTIRPIYGELSADPLHQTRAWQETLMALAHAAGSDKFMRVPAPPVSVATPTPTPLPPAPMSWYDFVRETWEKEVFAKGSFAATSFEEFWKSALRTGVLDTSSDEKRAAASKAPAFNSAAATKADPKAGSGDLVLLAAPTALHGDGESMAVPHLIEMPDPVSKTTWDNYAALAPATAEKRGLKEGQIVALTVGGESVMLPVFVQPGVHPEVVLVHGGWGRGDGYEGIGKGFGANIYPVLPVTAAGVQNAGAAATLAATGEDTYFANVQGHHYLYSPSYAGIMTNRRRGEVPANAQRNEDGEPVYDRPIFAETTWNEWKGNKSIANPNELPPGEKHFSAWIKEHKYVGHKWGMSVDLNACIACGACMVACSLENNLPVVGKKDVEVGREMHWLRLDRYYRGTKENPDFVTMPLMCQHCDNAPCETVCPVIATMHNDEGLNVMVYNRCVGTRYCANNCPYKVRRFNFWQYTDYRTGARDAVKREAPMELVLNPDVTVRTRGVMEKCTFCIQRIRYGKERAREMSQPVKDGDIQTACQQTCPTKAIVFGDTNDPHSEVSKHFADPRGYGLLDDLNTRPAVRYLALVRNRDEASGYRTKFQDHHMHHHGDDHGHDSGHGHSGGNDHGDHGHAPASGAGAGHH